jgi:hypothetical protein
VVESYDVAMLINVAKQVFKKARQPGNAAEIERLLNQFLELNNYRKRVAHGLWAVHGRWNGALRFSQQT